ncbi:MAG: hypothetical protein DRH50_02745 [Deltaproteobacteria bacterium]|nr:MAG: hypothetical protein DRH50_02745 [Deltaproteobacteria bacterium]
MRSPRGRSDFDEHRFVRPGRTLKSALVTHDLHIGKRPRPGKGGFEAVKTFQVPVYDGPGPGMKEVKNK